MEKNEILVSYGEKIDDMAYALAEAAALADLIGPRERRKLYAARDPVLCDAWPATQMGYRVEEIPYIGLAEKLGVGCADPAKAVIREISPPLPERISSRFYAGNFVVSNAGNLGDSHGKGSINRAYQ
ncbi:hypothetical protein [Treponema primitia]|uniref:hypothetical protein n=1 Tax=Treponema primitia TaxID=88058 RepID=UPI0002F78109|nr:hypothetical protein [Treponema primitia]